MTGKPRCATISKKVDPSAHKAFSPREVESLLRKAQELDLKYMEEAGVLVDGVAGDSFYDDDEAFEYISENLLKLFGGGEETAGQILALVDDYMDLQEEYLEQAGLVTPGSERQKGRARSGSFQTAPGLSLRPLGRQAVQQQVDAQPRDAAQGS